ncbi:MAG TPA: Na+/H+ antiporter NhaC family protein [Ignavibacteriaceae bacterium]|nr:Na+/H+ antiporter NhaC family protein [Ignavibacteriaceae bacterium]
MKKLRLLFIALIISVGYLNAQTVSISSVALSGLDFSVRISNLPDTIKIINAKLIGSDGETQFNLMVKNGSVDTTITVSESGNYKLTFIGTSIVDQNINVIPAWLSIVPPLVAILLALWLRQVIISLLIGIYLGAVFLNNFNPVIGLFRLIDTYIIKTLTDTSHVEIIVFTSLFGGVVGLISKCGGTKGLADVITRFAKKRKSGLISTWLMGIAIFFDDYANTLIVGNLMRPITDKMRISREKLSFIVDATSAPVVSLFVVSSWIGYEVGLIHDGLRIVGSTENAYDVFLQTIPYRFYPILMLVFVFLVSYFERDFGPMLKAEKRAVEKGKVLRDGAKVGNLTETSEIFGNEDKAKWHNAVVPILVLIFGTIAGLYYTGVHSLVDKGITEYGLRDIIGNSDSYISLLWASFAACMVAAIMIISQKIMNLSDTLDAWFIGVRSMLLALIILTLAWSIGSITQDIKTADYIIGIIGDTISPRFLPVIVFLVCALTSFSTGTSWGTMAIIMPIVIPLATVVPSFYHYSPMDSQIILHGVISSVLTGSVFGDHCSPISDTTILSSMASGCDHIDHVRTQLPYAVLVAVFCMLIGDIPTAYGFSPYLSIIIIAAILSFFLYFFGKKVDYVISKE